jgi:glyoxylase-like metal-dependent hydrolase (beta-lactamase superfamily II)
MRHVAVIALLVLASLVSALGEKSKPRVGPTLVASDWCRSLPRAGYKNLEREPIDDSWFEVYRVAPGVLAIYEPHQWEEAIDYLIEGHTRALLLDTGMGIGDLKRLVTHLTSLPIVVVNSHTHPDHTGNNWQFSTIYSFDSDYTRQNARGSNEIRPEIEPGKICGALPEGFDPVTYSTRPWKTARWLHNGDRIDIGGRSLQVLATPGHAPDSICLFEPANGLLFTGDTYYPGPIYVFGRGSDPAEYQRSVDTLARLAPRVRLVLGGHNEPVAPPSVLIELAREFDAIRAGKLPGKGEGHGISEYKGSQMTFLIANTK